jgi:hypothetical protein
MQIVRYHPSLKPRWDTFVAGSKNATFLFYRDYMDYHADRFCDHSLLFTKRIVCWDYYPAMWRRILIIRIRGSPTEAFY